MTLNTRETISVILGLLGIIIGLNLVPLGIVWIFTPKSMEGIALLIIGLSLIVTTLIKVKMDKWIKIGAIIGGIWGFISTFLVGWGTVGHGIEGFFANASLIHWIIFFPAMIVGYVDYSLGFGMGFDVVIFAIPLGVIIGCVIVIEIKKVGGKLK